MSLNSWKPEDQLHETLKENKRLQSRIEQLEDALKDITVLLNFKLYDPKLREMVQGVVDKAVPPNKAK